MRNKGTQEVPVHNMKINGRVEIDLHSFVVSPLDGVVNFTPKPL
jgi:hypothetical protein